MKSLILLIALIGFGACAMLAEDAENATSEEPESSSSSEVIVLANQEEESPPPPEAAGRADAGAEVEASAAAQEPEPVEEPEPIEEPEPVEEPAPVDEPEAVDPEAPVEEPEAVEEEPEPLVFDIDEPMDGDGVELEEGDLISVDFPDEEIRTVLRNVADIYDLNLVVPEELVGRTSVRLRNVRWEQVFDVILSPVGYTFIEEDNIVKVISLEALQQEPPITEVIILSYARANDVMPVVEPLIATEAGGRIQVDRRSNALVITERSNRLPRIREIIDDLDQPTAQVMIESKFVETTTENLRDIGVDWSSLGDYGIGAGPFEHQYQREGGTDGDTSRMTTAVFSAERFDIFLSALRTQDEVRLVSNPTIVTLDNTPALIAIGDRHPIPQFQFNPETASYEVTGFDYEDVGITLNVTPQVNPQGFINLDVRPEISDEVGTVNFGGAAGAQIPIISTRRTESEIVIRDGYTLAIGGLMDSASTTGETKVPVLGDIPGVGRLFRHDSARDDKRNLIIFITARTLDPEGSTFEEIVDPRRIHEMGLERSDIPGYRPDIPHFPEDVETFEEPPYEPDEAHDPEAGRAPAGEEVRDGRSAEARAFAERLRAAERESDSEAAVDDSEAEMDPAGDEADGEDTADSEATDSEGEEY